MARCPYISLIYTSLLGQFATLHFTDLQLAIRTTRYSDNSPHYISPYYISPHSLTLHFATVTFRHITFFHSYISPQLHFATLHFFTVTFRHSYISPQLHFATLHFVTVTFYYRFNLSHHISSHYRRMQYSTGQDAGQDWCRTGQMHHRSDAGQVGCITDKK